MPVVTDPNLYYTALLSGDYWNGSDTTGQPGVVTHQPVIVTYSFPTTAPGYDTSAPPPGLTAATASTFAAFSAAEQTQARNALSQWAAASGIIFIEVAPGQGDINFQKVDLTGTPYAGKGGVAYYPFGDHNFYSDPYYSGDLTASGDVYMNTQIPIADDTLLHEIGHAIGLKHPGETTFGHDATIADDPSLTIMATTGETGGTADQLKPADIAAAQYLYGASGGSVVTPTSPSSADQGTNSVSNWSWNPASQTLTQYAVAADEVIHGTSVNDVIHALSGNNSLFGLAGNNTLYAGSGDDKLYDGPGTNVLYGGAGNDSFYISNSLTTIVVNSTTGNDTVYATASYQLPANVKTLYVSGQGLTGRGNNQGDSLFGDGTYASTLIGGTGDDYMVGGAGNDTIVGGGGIDRMFGGGGADTFVFKAATDAPTGGVLTSIGDFASGTDKIDLSALRGSGGQALAFIGTGGFTGQAGQVNETTINNQTVLQADLTGAGSPDFQISFDNVGGASGPHVSIAASDLILNAACYVRGTRILTARGEIPIEALGPRDRVLTAAGAYRPVVWTGRRAIDPTRHPDPAAVQPVRVSAHAFGEGLPHRDLLVSPGHNIPWEGALMPISSLVNGVSVSQINPRHVEYWHVELDAHDVIFAEGLPAESYLDAGNRTAFDNGGAFIEAHPDFRPKHWGDTCLPLIHEGPQVERAREHLRELLLAQGYALTHDANACLLADGERAEPLRLSPTRLAFAAPEGVRSLNVVSDVFAPFHTIAGNRDRRQLGLCVQRVQIDGADIPLDRFDAPGWHEAESRDGAFSHRWTSGAAQLPAGARVVVVDLAGHGVYWRAPLDKAAALFGERARL